jgi:hypothetical protein
MSVKYRILLSTAIAILAASHRWRKSRPTTIGRRIQTLQDLLIGKGSHTESAVGRLMIVHHQNPNWRGIAHCLVDAFLVKMDRRPGLCA